MKGIFRGVLVMRFTDNSEGVSMENLREYMRENKSYKEETLLQYVEQFESLIEELLNSSNAQNEEEVMEQMGMRSEMIQIWRAEKDRVISHMMKGRTQGDRIEKLQWSVNNQFYGRRHKNINELTCISKTNEGEFHYETFEMRKEDIRYVEDEFKKIEQTINALLI